MRIVLIKRDQVLKHDKVTNYFKRYELNQYSIPKKIFIKKELKNKIWKIINSWIKISNTYALWLIYFTNIINQYSLIERF